MDSFSHSSHSSSGATDEARFNMNNSKAKTQPHPGAVELSSHALSQTQMWITLSSLSVAQFSSLPLGKGQVKT